MTNSRLRLDRIRCEFPPRCNCFPNYSPSHRCCSLLACRCCRRRYFCYTPWLIYVFFPVVSGDIAAVGNSPSRLAFRQHLLMCKIPFLPSSAAESCQTNRTQPTSKTWVDRCSARKAFEFEVRARLPSTNGMFPCIAPFEFGQYIWDLEIPLNRAPRNESSHFLLSFLSFTITLLQKCYNLIHSKWCSRSSKSQMMPLARDKNSMIYERTRPSL